MENVTQVVVGHPRHLSGEAGTAAAAAERFAQALAGAIQVPVALQDERLSTVEAARRLADAGVSASNAKLVIDETAATVILESYLAAWARSRSSPGPDAAPDPS